MTPEEVALVLGEDTVEAVRTAVCAAYVRSRSTGDNPKGSKAIEELLVAMLASVIDAPGSCMTPQQRAERCAERLTAIMDRVAADRLSC